MEATLTETPKLRMYQLPQRVGFCVRTIERRVISGDFPPPDYIEKAGRKQWPVWFATTIEAWLKGKLKS